MLFLYLVYALHFAIASCFYYNFPIYSIIEATRPEPTVRPPSRIRSGKPRVAKGVFSGFFVIIFSESIDFLYIFKIFVANLQPQNKLLLPALHSFLPLVRPTANYCEFTANYMFSEYVNAGSCLLPFIFIAPISNK